MHSLIEQFSPSGAFAGPAGRALLACLVSFALTMIFAPRVIRELISLKIGQPIRTAEEVHKLAELHGAKAGTPTMGGVLIVGSMTAATLLCARMGNPFIISCLIVTLALGLLGFRDDYLKVAKKTSDGISARKKLLVQFLAGLAGVTFLYLYPEGSPRVELHDYISSLFIPFYGQVNLPWFVYIPFGVVVVMSASNAVNLTDGLDGLASGCSVATGITYAIIAVLCGSWLTADSLDIPFHPGAGEISVFMMALVGACLGFLWHNCYPAEGIYGRHRFPGPGRRVRHGCRLHGAGASLYRHRGRLRHGSRVRRPAGGQLQAAPRQTHLRHGPHPPPFRTQRLEGNAGDCPLLDDQPPAGFPGPFPDNHRLTNHEHAAQ